MALFKLYDCDVGLTIRGVNYDFEHVDSVTIEDPEKTRLIRGGNAGNKMGLDYKEGLKEAKSVTTSVISIPAALHDLLKDVYKTRERFDFYCVSRADGSSKIAKNCILAQSPKQLTLDDSAESLNTQLMFESFDIDEKHKT